MACFIQAAQQLGGINAIICEYHSACIVLTETHQRLHPDYSGTVFQQSIGFSPHMAALMSGFLQTWFFVASFIPWVRLCREKICLGEAESEYSSSLIASDAVPWYFDTLEMMTPIANGRQLISMISLMAAVLAINSALVYQVQYDTAIARKSSANAFLFSVSFGA